MKLSPTWKQAWARISVQCMGWATAFIGWWMTEGLGTDLKVVIGARGALAIIGGLLLIGLVGSVIDQPYTRNGGGK